MTIDVQTEELLTLREAASAFPARRSWGSPLCSAGSPRLASVAPFWKP